MSTHGTLKRVAVERLGDGTFLIMEQGSDDVDGSATQYRSSFETTADAIVQLAHLLNVMGES